MPPRRLFVLASLLLLALPLTAQRLVSDSLASRALGRTVRYRALLPEHHDRAQRWPGMILLHGFGGNESNWTTFTDLEPITAELPLVIVMPDGQSAWYVNNLAEPGLRFEDLIMQDVRRLMAERYGVDTTRVSIAGLSMGGYGSLVLGLRHPKAFTLVAPLSASMDVPTQIPLLGAHGRQGMRPELERAFGRDSSSVWARHDPFTLVSTMDTAGAPFFYVATGIQDEFRQRLGLHRKFVEVLRTRGFAYEYHESPGRHNWDYWGRAIAGVMKKWAAMNGPKP